MREAKTSLPPEPSAQFQRLALHNLQAMPRRDRGRFTIVAGVCGAVGAGSLAVWVMTAWPLWLVLGGLFLLTALLSALWLSPPHIEALICQVQREYQRLQEAYATECSQASNGTLPKASQALEADAVGAAHSGLTSARSAKTSCSSSANSNRKRPKTLPLKKPSVKTWPGLAKKPSASAAA